MALFSALNSRNYRLFFAGQAFANLGMLTKQVAISWLVYRLTNSPLLLGLVSFSSELPAFLLASTAGVVADRFNKHHLLLIAHSLITINALVLGYLTVTGSITIGWVMAAQVVFGSLTGFEIPARQAFINDLVPDKTYLTQAIALNSTLFNTARIVGPSLAGILIPLVGEGWCFLTYSLLSASIVAFFLHIRPEVFRPRETPFRFRAELVEGVTYVYQSPPIRLLLVLVAAVTLLGVSYLVILPVFAHQILHGDATLFGYMTSATGVGSVIGAIYISRRSQLSGLSTFIYAGAAIFGLSLACFSLSETVWISLVMLAFAGLGRVMVFTGANTLLQTLADADKRGRVLSLYFTLFMGSLTLGNLLVGALTGIVGANYVLLVNGSVCVLAAFGFSRYRRVFQQLDYHEVKAG